MKHIFYIDPIEKLNFKKDSSIMMAQTFKELGMEVYFLFEKDFFLVTDKLPKLNLYSFKAQFKNESSYLEKFSLESGAEIQLRSGDIVHMRIDPPYDSRYQRYLWMLEFIQSKGVRIVNDPVGIMKNNEKLTAFKDTAMSPLSFVGSSEEGFVNFLKRLQNEKLCDEIIMKPLDLYSGIGVEKFSLYSETLISSYQAKVKEFGGAIIVQPFFPEVYKGELRSIFYAGKELGTIIKFPNEGSFLSNVAQGATFDKIELPHKLRIACQDMAWELKESGVDFVAFDLLAGKITEVNVTCPGLLVEVSEAYKENLAKVIAKSFL
ncbi:MAG: glutathione synthase [Thermoproteota archaeon]|jgi:glutathione synthase